MSTDEAIICSDMIKRSIARPIPLESDGRSFTWTPAVRSRIVKQEQSRSRIGVMDAVLILLRSRIIFIFFFMKK